MSTPTLSATISEDLVSWSVLFQFAAELYLQEPSETLLKKCGLFGEALADSLPGERFASFFQEATAEAPDQLRQEFYDLFFVPMSGAYTLPYESAQREKSLAGGVHHAVGTLFRATGFDIMKINAPAYIKAINRTDYIGFELSFVADLIHAAATADNREDAEGLRATALSFCQHHLTPWAVTFGKNMADNAQSRLFKGCGELTVFVAKNFPLDMALDNKITDAAAA